MRKILSLPFTLIGIALLVLSGWLGHQAYQAYQERNQVATALEKGMQDWNEAMKDTPFKVDGKIDKEVPKETWYAGAGAVVSLLFGAGLTITGKIVG